MPYDEAVAERVRARLARRNGLVEKRMFGAVGFVLDGNTCLGVWKDSLIVRVGRDAYEAALGEPGAGEFDVTGRPMRGWVLVAPAGFADEGDLVKWIALAVDFTRTLPPK